VVVEDPYCGVELLVVIRTLEVVRSAVVVRSTVVVVTVLVNSVDLDLVLATLVAITAHDDSPVGPSVGVLAVGTHVLHGLLDERSESSVDVLTGSDLKLVVLADVVGLDVGLSERKAVGSGSLGPVSLLGILILGKEDDLVLTPVPAGGLGGLRVLKSSELGGEGELGRLLGSGSGPRARAGTSGDTVEHGLEDEGDHASVALLDETSLDEVLGGSGGKVRHDDRVGGVVGSYLLVI
jgi:hypothetical protein